MATPPEHRVASRTASRRFHPAESAVILLITAYQAVVRPLLVGSCKFYPTCSAYAIEAIREHGLLRGASLAARRLVRCHPFAPGGIDPVPSRYVSPGQPARRHR